VTQPRPGVYVFDLGQSIVGRARLRAATAAGTTVTLRYGEMLEPDGTVSGRAARAGKATDMLEGIAARDRDAGVRLLAQQLLTDLRR
jgi:hypothetical protein